jgi:HAMP domain-containing protein
VALSTKQKHRTIYYLGWPGLTLVSGSTHYNSVVNDRLANLNDEIEKLVKEILERLENLDKSLDEAKCRLTASKVDNIELNKDEIYHLKKERMRQIRELSDHLDIPIMKTHGNTSTVIV